MQLCLLYVIDIKVNIATCPDEFAWKEVTLLCHHLRQQCIAGDIEGHSKEVISTSLVELA